MFIILIYQPDSIRLLHQNRKANVQRLLWQTEWARFTEIKKKTIGAYTNHPQCTDTPCDWHWNHKYHLRFTHKSVTSRQVADQFRQKTWYSKIVWYRLHSSITSRPERLIHSRTIPTFLIGDYTGSWQVCRTLIVVWVVTSLIFWQFPRQGGKKGRGRTGCRQT